MNSSQHRILLVTLWQYVFSNGIHILLAWLFWSTHGCVKLVNPVKLVTQWYWWNCSPVIPSKQGRLGTCELAKGIAAYIHFHFFLELLLHYLFVWLIHELHWFCRWGLLLEQLNSSISVVKILLLTGRVAQTNFCMLWIPGSNHLLWQESWLFGACRLSLRHSRCASLPNLGQSPGSRAVYNATARAATGSQPIPGRGRNTLPANPVAGQPTLFGLSYWYQFLVSTSALLGGRTFVSFKYLELQKGQ